MIISCSPSALHITTTAATLILTGTPPAHTAIDLNATGGGWNLVGFPAALAHSLKGAGGSMGYDDLFEPARALEAAAHGADERAAGRALAQLERLAGRIALAVPAAPAHLDEVSA